jgi:spore germination protein KB
LFFALFFSIAKLYLLYKIFKLSEGRNFSELWKSVAGEKVGAFILLLYVLYAVVLSSKELGIASNFIYNTSLFQTPVLVISVSMLVVCLYGAIKGENSILRLSRVLFPFAILTVLLCAFLLIKNVDLKLLEVKRELFRLPSLKSIAGVSAYPFGDTVVLLGLLGKLKENTVNKRSVILPILLAGSSALLGGITSVSVLGTSYAQNAYYPGYISASIISIGKFFTRFELVMWSVFIVCEIVKISVIVYFAVNILKDLFHRTRTKWIALFLAIPIILISALNTELSKSEAPLMYIIFSNIFQLALPFTLLFFMLRYKRKKQ